VRFTWGPGPVQAGRRWPVERTHAWANQYGKLRWCTERRRLVVEFWLALAAAVIVFADWSVVPGPATAGTPAHDDGPDHLRAQALSGLPEVVQVTPWPGDRGDR
jgi:hypothetical protein